MIPALEREAEWTHHSHMGMLFPQLPPPVPFPIRPFCLRFSSHKGGCRGSARSLVSMRYWGTFSSTVYIPSLNALEYRRLVVGLVLILFIEWGQASLTAPTIFHCLGEAASLLLRLWTDHGHAIHPTNITALRRSVCRFVFPVGSFFSRTQRVL